MKHLIGNLYMFKAFNLIPIIGIRVNSVRKAIILNIIAVLVTIAVVLAIIF